MTPEQQSEVFKAINALNDAREHLDIVMYRTDPINAEEFKKIRSCYDKICQALDRL